LVAALPYIDGISSVLPGRWPGWFSLAKRRLMLEGRSCGSQKEIVTAFLDAVNQL